MVKHKVWITRNNFEKAKDNVRSFDKIILKEKAMKMEQNLIFYLPYDDKIEEKKNLVIISRPNIEEKSIQIIEKAKQVNIVKEEAKPITIEKPKSSLNISIDRRKSGTIKIEFGRKNEAVIIKKLKDEKILNVFPTPEFIQFNNATDKEEKNVIPKAGEAENLPKSPISFTFEKVKGRNINV
jgi:hypothetical protein